MTVSWRPAVLALLAWTGLAAQEPAPEPSYLDRLDEAAGRVLEAAAAGEDALERAAGAAATAIDPFKLVESLWGRALAVPPEGGEGAVVKAMQALAAVAAARPERAGLAAYVRELVGADAARRAGDLAMHRLYRAVFVANEAGRFDEAVAACDAAEAACAEAAPGVSLALVFHELSYARQERREWRAVIEAGRESLRVARAIGWFEQAARAASVTNEAAFGLRDLDAALAFVEEEIALRERGGDPRRFAVAFQKRATVRRERGEIAAACVDYERAFAIADAAGERVQAVDARRSLGYTMIWSGRVSEGLDFLDLALAEATALGDPATLSLCRGTVAAADLHLRRWDRVIEGLQAKIADDARRQLRPGRFDHLNLAHALVARNRFDEARRALDAQLALSERLGDRGGLDQVYVLLARIETRAGDRKNALEHCKRAVAVSREAAGVPSIIALGNLGAALWRLGRHTEAQAAYTDARERARAQGDLAAEARFDRELAVVLLEQGEPEAALAATERWAKLRLQAGRGRRPDEALLEREEAQEGATPALAAAHALLERPGAPRTAILARLFHVLESGRAATLLEHLSGADAAFARRSDPALAAARADALSRLDRAHRVLLERAAAPDAPREALAAARAELDLAYRALDDALLRLRRGTDAAAGAPVDVPVVALEAFQASLARGAAYVHYALSDEGDFALVVTRDGADLVALGGGPDLKERVAAFVDLLAVPGSEEEEAARQLYAVLVLPLEGRLAGCRELIVSPDEVLSFLPFEVLLRDAGGRAERLVERFPVSYVPSASVAVALDAVGAALATAKGFVALADPLYPGEEGAPPPPDPGRRGPGRLDRLPGTAAEAAAAAAAFPDEERSVLTRGEADLAHLASALAARPAPPRALHFACHGYFDAGRPRYSGLVLARGEVLSVEWLAERAVRSGLVVLSACESGRAELRAGEGAMGLVRGFFIAGSPRVIAAQWRVADREAARFMAAFYGAFGRDGLPVGEALRAARLELLRAGGASAHPSSWAAFTLWGLGR